MSVATQRGRAAGRREGAAGLSPTAIRVLSVMVGVLAWEAYGRILHAVVFTSPSAVVRAAYELIAAGELQFYLKSSGVVLSLGLVLAIVLGIPLGVLMGRRAVIEHAVDPYVNALYATPLVAVIPVIVVWLGFQTKAKVVLVFLFCIFPILINTYQGVKNTDARLVEVARSFCSKEWRFWGGFVFSPSAPLFLARGPGGPRRRAVRGGGGGIFTPPPRGRGVIRPYSETICLGRPFLSLGVLLL